MGVRLWHRQLPWILKATPAASLLSLAMNVAGNTNITWSQPTTLTLQAGRAINLSPEAVIINTNAGATPFNAIVLQANQGATATPGNYTGITLNNARLQTGTGNITVTGTSVNGTNDNIGVFLDGANTRVSTTNGTINITGTSNGTGANNRGIVITNGAVVNATSTGNVTLTGTGGNGTRENQGLLLRDLGTRVTTNNGNLTITGTGNGTADRNFGMIFNGVVVDATGTGNVTLTGTGGNCEFRKL